MTKDRHIFEIKGTIHPQDRFIAYLRYVPSIKGNRVNKSGMRYRKIYDLREREIYLADKHPIYLWKDDVHGRVLQSVPKDCVAYWLNPVEYLNELRDSGRHLNSLQRASLDLIEALVRETQLKWSDIGITGSQLLGLDTDVSDIDLVVYGETSCRHLYSFLKKHSDLIPNLKRYDGVRLDRHVDFRWGDKNPYWDEMREIESKKVLQGLYQSYDFFIRLVKKTHETGTVYRDMIFRPKGIRVVKCRVVDNKDMIFTPAIYEVKCSEVPTLRKFVSYRGRFTEHVKRGKVVEARGEIQSVMDSSSKMIEQWMLLGERVTDYLLPL